MKLSDVKHKIDAYFNSVSPLEIVKQFEVLGYEFEKIEDDIPFEFHASKIKHAYKPFENSSIEVVSIFAEIQGVSFIIESDVLEIQQTSTDQIFTTEQFVGNNYGLAMAA